MSDDIKFKKVGKRPPAKAQAEDVPSAEGELSPDTRAVLIRADDLRGVRGMRGERGDVGRRGRRGLKGEPGDEGEAGDKGAQGTAGQTGLTGRQGDAGTPGRPGTPGNKGDKGETGPVPRHKWEGTKLSFELPTGRFGRAVNLLGPAGGRGGAGNAVKETWQSIELQGQELVFVKNTAGPLGKETRVDLSSLAGGGFAGLGPWRFRTELVAPPGSGQARFNNANVELATEFYLHETNNDGEDLANFLNLLDAGDVLYMQDAGNAANFTVIEISSNVDSGVYRTFGISNIAQQGAALGQNTVVNFVATIAGGGAGSVVTGLTIDVANILTLTQTAGGNQTVDLSQFLTAAASDLLYLRLDTTNDPLTGTLATQSIVPDGNTTRDVGLVSNRYRRIFGRLGAFVNSPLTPVVTLPANANHGGIIGGTQNGPGALSHVLNGGGFPAAACIGVAAANNAAGTGSIEATRGGATVIGAAYAYGTGTARLLSSGYSSTAIGYAYGAGTSTLEATNSGALAFGYARGRQGANTALISSRGNGSFATGNANAFSGGGSCTIEAVGPGAFAAGYARSSAAVLAQISATGAGAFAQGNVGTTAVAATILASGNGSFAQGNATSGQTISAIATNAVQFGPGTNALADSLQVGAAGLRFKGTAGAPGALQNGDMWVNAGFVYVRSNGVSIQIAGPGPLTN